MSEITSDVCEICLQKIIEEKDKAVCIGCKQKYSHQSCAEFHNFMCQSCQSEYWLAFDRKFKIRTTTDEQNVLMNVNKLMFNESDSEIYAKIISDRKQEQEDFEKYGFESDLDKLLRKTMEKKEIEKKEKDAEKKEDEDRFRRIMRKMPAAFKMDKKDFYDKCCTFFERHGIDSKKL